MVNIQEILHYQNIMRVIEVLKGGVPGDILDAAFFSASDSTIGNTGYFFKVSSTRKVAQAVMYGSPSKAAQMEGVSKVPVTLLHTFEHFFHDPNTVAMLMSETGGMQQRGVELAARKTKNFAQRFVNLRRAAWYQALTTGKIYLDGNGNLVTRASDAQITVDFGIPAGNKNQLDALGDGAIITASWATAATDIPLQIAGIQQAAAQLSGYPITTAYYGKNVASYIAKNTAMKEFLKLAPPSNLAIQKGGIPDGFINLKWRPAYAAFYEDHKGTARTFWGDDTVIFTPDANEDGWKGLIEGSYAIPTDLGTVSNDVMEALASLMTAFGMFGYASISNDPVTIKQFGGDTFLPVINVPKSIFIADVTP